MLRFCAFAAARAARCGGPAVARLPVRAMAYNPESSAAEWELATELERWVRGIITCGLPLPLRWVMALLKIEHLPPCAT